jgi:hypothetical protein
VGRHRQLVASAFGCGAYLVASWLLLSRLVVGGVGPVDQSGLEASPVFIAIDAPATTPADLGATTKKVLIIHVEDGLTHSCFVGVGLVSADAIMVTVNEFVAIARELDCT